MSGSLEIHPDGRWRQASAMNQRRERAFRSSSAAACQDICGEGDSVYRVGRLRGLNADRPAVDRG